MLSKFSLRIPPGEVTYAFLGLGLAACRYLSATEPVLEAALEEGPDAVLAFPLFAPAEPAAAEPVPEVAAVEEGPPLALALLAAAFLRPLFDAAEPEEELDAVAGAAVLEKKPETLVGSKLVILDHKLITLLVVIIIHPTSEPNDTQSTPYPPYHMTHESGYSRTDTDSPGRKCSAPS